MLFDLHNEIYYDFPFSIFLDLLKLSNSHNINIVNYIDRWYSVFEILEKRVDDERAIFLDKNLIKKNNNGYEYFQYSLDFPALSNNFLFHFDIESIKNNAKKIRSRFVNTKKFEKQVCYDKEANEHTSLKKIIVCPFHPLTPHLLVIDGNHSLNTALKYKLPFLRYIHYFPHSSDFIFAIEWAMYLLVNEVCSGCLEDNSATWVLDDKFFVEQLDELMN